AAAQNGFGGIVDEAGLDGLRQLDRKGLAGAARQFGLRIEGVDVADAAVHEEVDDALGFGRSVRRLRREQVCSGGLDQAREGHQAEAAPGLGQQVSSSHLVYPPLQPRLTEVIPHYSTYKNSFRFMSPLASSAYAAD